MPPAASATPIANPCAVTRLPPPVLAAVEHVQMKERGDPRRRREREVIADARRSWAGEALSFDPCPRHVKLNRASSTEQFRVPLTIRRIHAQVAPPWICISSNAPARELVDTIVAEMRRPSPNRRTVADRVRTLIELIN